MMLGKNKMMQKKIDIKLYEKINEDKVKCLLCPHFCLLKKGKKGKCKIRICDDKRGDKISLSNYGQLTHIAVEPIGKKPIVNFLSKTKTLSVGVCGCNLKCKFCENYYISQCDDFDSGHYSPCYIVDLAKRKNCESICMTYNEPIISFEYLLDIAKECHKQGLKFIIKTNAYINKEPWKEICKVIDAVNIDWKGSKTQYKEVCGVNIDDNLIYDRIKEAYQSNVHVEISIPIHQGILKEEERVELHRFGSFLINLNSDIYKSIPCHLLKVYPAYKYEKYSTTSDKDIAKVYSILSKYIMNNIFIK